MVDDDYDLDNDEILWQEMWRLVRGPGAHQGALSAGTQDCLSELSRAKRKIGIPVRSCV